MQVEHALPAPVLEACDLPAVVHEDSSEDDGEGPTEGHVSMAFMHALSAQGLLPPQGRLPLSSSQAALHEQEALQPCSPPPLDLHPDADAYLDLSPAGSQEEGGVEALARSMQDFMLGAFPLPRPRRPLRVVRNSNTAKPAAQPQQPQRKAPGKAAKSPRGAARSSLSPRRSHGKRAAPMQAPDQAAAPIQRLGGLPGTDKDSSTTTTGDGDSEGLAGSLGSSAVLEAGLLSGQQDGGAGLAEAGAAQNAANAHLLDVADHFGRCPLHVAAAAGRADIVMHLLQAGCDGSRWLPSDYRYTFTLPSVVLSTHSVQLKLELLTCRL